MAETADTTGSAKPEFRMQKMYVKDLSFENPNAPEVFTVQQSAEPKVEVNLQLNNKQVDEDHWEVALEITAKVSTKADDKVLFILEVEHAAIFKLKNIPKEHMPMLLGVDCPTLLFPFTRQIVSQVSIDGGFVPFLMEPVNFMALFQKAQKEKKQAKN
ncbi:protein-export chaperone SecB [Desulforhopalus singaporensis]|uniref:Protein translocase subunit secB n=1 Tax=Desulforhopalus singaporensis TaxID=91360 RepID=A0A1H0SEW5_9BACT|nr:protein-export chaperone SecB [Desulforhopalus singaporensis]SDP40059.1 protein translocase subunit secB [Desulforhopalus singaporensis]